MKLTWKDAHTVLHAGLQRAEAIGQPMNIAVVDSGGRLVAFARMDGAIWASIDISQKKAVTAISMNLDTRDIGPLTQPGGPLFNLEHTNGGMVTFGGGVVLRNASGEPVGAVGVSAGSVEQDHDVAEAAAAAYPKS